MWYHHAKFIGYNVCVLFRWRGSAPSADRRLISLSLRHHLRNVAVAPWLRLLLRLGRTGQGEGGGVGSLCVGGLFTQGGLYAGGKTLTLAPRSGSRRTAGRVWISRSRCPRVRRLRGPESLHQGSHSDSLLFITGESETINATDMWDTHTHTREVIRFCKSSVKSDYCSSIIQMLRSDFMLWRRSWEDFEMTVQ